MNNIDKLLEVMQQLRDPETGCPWDKKQTFETIVPYTLEEAYEVQEAILKNDTDALCQELGDLLLQVVYHAQIAKEQGLFDFQQVVEGICEKMIRRHPHVFGDEKIDTAEEQSVAWERIKQDERLQSNKNNNNSILNDVNVNLPALMRAQKLQRKAAKVGFDWNELTPVIRKIEEELSELEDEITRGSEKELLSDELGDLIFACVNLARHLDINADFSLEKTNQKFIRRFQYIESRLEEFAIALEDSSLEELDALWREAKAKGL